MPLRSTLSQQLILLDELTHNFDNKITSEMIYLDFSKAFDSVSHKKLLHLLDHLSIDGKILHWITGYLSERTQQTVVDGIVSEPCDVRSGVPQGSVLGPLLFLLYLEDLIRSLQRTTSTTVYAFADDLKLLNTDPSQLQQSLDIVERWCSIWQLKIQPSKSDHISFSNTSLDLHTTYFSINNTPIRQSKTVKDLGIILSRDLKWSSHVQTTFSKCSSLSFIILKSFKSKDPFFYLQLFKVYIRPVIEYNINTWMPSLVSDVEKIESIQANFTKRLCKKLNIKFNSYFHRLQILNLESLENRGIKSDLILTYKIINNLIDIDQNTIFIINPCVDKYNLRRHESHLRTKTIAHSSTRQQFFSHRTINIWNKLPNEVIKAKSLPIFKSKLNCLDLSKFYVSKLKL